MQANVLPFNTPPVLSLKVKTFFSEEVDVAYYIMQLKCLTLCTPLVKRSDIEIVQISII